MDISKRQITKISREVSKFTVKTLRESGVGTAEFDFIHLVRKNPGITQAEIRDILKLDKGAAARRAANLEAKGYLVRKENPEDQRSRLLFATEKADLLKNSKAAVEAKFYEWLLSDFTEDEKEQFAELLDRIHTKCKEESLGGFKNMTKLMGGEELEDGENNGDK